MKKISFIIILLISISFLTSCSEENTSILDNITAPENNNIPISGKWIIEDYKLYGTGNMNEKLAKTYVGDEVLFHEKVFALGDEHFLDPTFKIKNVKVSDYFRYQYNINPEKLNMNIDETQVVSMIKEGKVLYVFIKKSEDSFIVNIDGGFFLLTKLAEEIEEEKIAEYIYSDNSKFKVDNINEDDTLGSALLIGLRSIDVDNKDSNMKKWNYRTIFLRTYNKNIESVYEMNNIFLPRKTGFWNIEVNRDEIDGQINDNIIASPIDKTLDHKKENKVNKEKDTLKNILYVGNDYISIEKINSLDKGKTQIQLYFIDNLDEGKPISITDIAGDLGKKDFLEPVEKIKDFKTNERNFGLFRRNGHWIFKGRYNFIEDKEYKYNDFRIKYIPPKEIVHYDELPISWNTIKSKVPEAVDAFMSPNDDMIIITTVNKILVYLINEGDISNVPAEKIQLKPGEKPIMAEWAIGKYSHAWDEEFLKRKGKSIK